MRQHSRRLAAAFGSHVPLGQVRIGQEALGTNGAAGTSAVVLVKSTGVPGTAVAAQAAMQARHPNGVEVAHTAAQVGPQIG